MNDELAKKLWEYLDKRRGITPLSDSLYGWLEQAGDVTLRRERLNVWLASVGSARFSEAGEFLSTAEVASFMAKLGSVGGGTSVLDPACGVGLLLSLAAEGLGASVIHGIELNAQVAGMAELLLSAPAKIFNGNTLNGTFPLEREYDLIISEPPFGHRLKPPYSPSKGGEILTETGDALLCWAASKLSNRGRVVFLVSASCLTARGDRMWKSLSAEGVHVRALIHVPSGHLKATAIESYIAVVDRTFREKVFSAQFGIDVDLQRQITANFEAHRAGKRPAQGRLVEFSTFQGFKSLEATERLQEMAKRKGLQAVPMQSLIKAHEVLKGSEVSVVDAANDLYLPLTGRCEAVLHPGALTAKSGKVARLVINGELADARFVAATLNSEIGQLFIESISLPSAILKQISMELLLQGTFYLPSVQVQSQVLKAMSSVYALRAALDEIESSVWAHPSQVEKQIQQLRRVNHKDTLENWLEGLPFPLASILWRYRASNGSTKDKNEILLHFFEAVALFWATIYLSAAKSDREFWADNVTSLDEILKRGKLSFDRATFGLWKCVVEFLSTKFRKLLNDDADRCTAMFRTNARDVLEMLFDSRLVTVLQTANSVRNNHAHGGVASVRDNEMAHTELEDLIQTCRSVMGMTWERYELVQPGECRFVGGQFGYKVRRVMGTRTPFTTVERKTIEGMEDGVLHLLDPDGERALKLLAFIRVMPSPKTEENACYFYNRRQASKQKFVSYHCEADSEIEEFYPDTLAALEGMRPFGTQSPVSESQDN
ncbi:MAG: N-6 DNA methylase [Rhodospirillales bacterium]|nr:N-6 DNA methylase [Rhodospirillales bacterium]